MRPHVVVQMLHAGKHLGAFSALIRLFPRVDATMSSKVAVVHKSLAAIVAYKRFFTRVRTDVHDKVVTAGKSPATDPAAIRAPGSTYKHNRIHGSQR